VLSSALLIHPQVQHFHDIRVTAGIIMFLHDPPIGCSSASLNAELPVAGLLDDRSVDSSCASMVAELPVAGLLGNDPMDSWREGAFPRFLFEELTPSRYDCSLLNGTAFPLTHTHWKNFPKQEHPLKYGTCRQPNLPHMRYSSSLILPHSQHFHASRLSLNGMGGDDPLSSSGALLVVELPVAGPGGVTIALGRVGECTRAVLVAWLRVVVGWVYCEALLWDVGLLDITSASSSDSLSTTLLLVAGRGSVALSLVLAR
jgi:hypothetical protein